MIYNRDFNVDPNNHNFFRHRAVLKSSILLYQKQFILECSIELYTEPEPYIEIYISMYGSVQSQSVQSALLVPSSGGFSSCNISCVYSD